MTYFILIHLVNNHVLLFSLTDINVSPNGTDNSDCGTVLSPCKSIKFAIENVNRSYVTYAISVMHVEGSFMTCDRIHTTDNLRMVGINGKPIFNCSHNCEPFIVFGHFWGPASTLTIHNVEFINKGCNASLIIVIGYSPTSILLTNIFFKEPSVPVITIGGIFNSLVIRNCSFLASDGIKVLAGNYPVGYGFRAFLMIETSQFIGGMEETCKGIQQLIKYTLIPIKVIIKSTVFKHLASAVSIEVSSPVSLAVHIKNSTFSNLQ